MAEVAIKAVEAVFDWRAYLKEEFNLDIPYENEENAGRNQSQENDGEGNLPRQVLPNDDFGILIKRRN